MHRILPGHRKLKVVLDVECEAISITLWGLLTLIGQDVIEMGATGIREVISQPIARFTSLNN